MLHYYSSCLPQASIFDPLYILDQTTYVSILHSTNVRVYRSIVLLLVALDST